MTTFQTAVELFPSYFSSFFPPNVGETRFNQESMHQNFLSDASTNGIGIPNRFLLFIESPWLNEKFKFAQTRFDIRMMLRCWSVNIPAHAFQTHIRDISGPARKIPYTSTFGEQVTMQFYCSPDMAEFGFFKKWMNGIIDPVSRYVSFYDDFAKDTKATLLFIPNNMKTIDKVLDAYAAKKLRGLRFTELYPNSMSVQGGTVEWAPGTKPSFVSIDFGFREAVDITTYDNAINEQLKALADISANPTMSNLTKFLQDQGGEGLAVDGFVVPPTTNSDSISYDSEIRQSSLARGGLFGSKLGTGELYADRGFVKSFNINQSGGLAS